MPRITVKPIQKQFEIFYEGEKGSVTVKQATTGDRRAVQDLFAEGSQTFDDSGRIKSYQMRINSEEIRRAQAYATMVACDFEDEDGQLIFKSKVGERGEYLAMSRAEFNKMWDLLPPLLTSLIHAKVLELNPEWDMTTGE